MTDETIEGLVSAFAHVSEQISGVADFDASYGEMLAFFEKIMHELRHFTSLAEMRSYLKTIEEPSPTTLALLVASMSLAPQLFESQLRSVAKNFLQNTAQTGRRVAIREEEYPTVCNEVSEWERKGRTCGEAKKFVARQRQVSARTVHRIWVRRSEFPSSAIPLSQVEEFLAPLLEHMSRLR